MEKLSVLLCLLAVLPHCQAGSEVQMVELPHEDVADIKEETEASAPLQSAADSTSEPKIDMAQKLEALEATMRALEATVKDLEATVGVQEEKIRELEESNNQLIESNSTLADSRMSAGIKVAFSAGLSCCTFGPANFLHSLVYNNVLTNIGGRYSPVTGYFIAPVRGVYYFTFTLYCLTQRSHTCGGSLYRNGYHTVSWNGFSRYNPSSGSNSAVLLLQVGDHVNVRLWANRLVYSDGNRYSTFSGFLLYSI